MGQFGRGFILWNYSVQLQTSSDLSVHHSTLIGDAIYWLLQGCGILQIHLKGQSLIFIEQPPDVSDDDGFKCRITQSEGRRLGLAVLVEPSIQIWQREADLSDAAKWVLHKTVRLNKFLPKWPKDRIWPLGIMANSEETDVIFLWTHFGAFMIHLESMATKKVFGKMAIKNIYPYSSFQRTGTNLSPNIFGWKYRNIIPLIYGWCSIVFHQIVPSVI